MPDSTDELPGIERLAHLEDRLYRVSEVFKSLQKENEYLRGQVAALNTRIRHLTAEKQQRSEEMRQLEEQREQVRKKLEQVMGTLALLEARTS